MKRYNWLIIFLMQFIVIQTIAITPVAPMEIFKNKSGSWVPLYDIADYVKLAFSDVIFKDNQIRNYHGVRYVNLEELKKYISGESIYRPDIGRLIIDAPGIPMPLSLERLGDFPADGEKLFIQSKGTLKQLSVLPWKLYSNALPAIDKNDNMYWVKDNKIYYKQVDSMNYQEIYKRLDCNIKIRGFDTRNNLICEIINTKPGEHEIWLIKNDGTSKLIAKGINIDVSPSGEMLAFCRWDSDKTKLKVYIKSLTNDNGEIAVSDGTRVEFAPDSASMRYYRGEEIIRRSLINGTPGEIISSIYYHFIDEEISIWSDDNKLLGGKSQSGIFVFPADFVSLTNRNSLHYLTGNPDDFNPHFYQNDMLFLRNNRLMKIATDDSSVEKEIFPGMHISSYKLNNNNLIFTASGALKKVVDFRIDIDVNSVIKAVEKSGDCIAGEVKIEQITPENATGIISRKYISSMQREAWKNAENISRDMLGFYDEQTRKVYLIPQNIKKIAVGISEKDIAKIVLAHELTHKIQSDINNYSPANFDSQLAWAAVTEGQAMVIADKVAEEMKIPIEAVIKIGSFTKNITPNKLSSNQEIAGKMTAEIYRVGKYFMNWHNVNSSNSKMWQIIKKPPSSTNTLYHPQNYPEKSMNIDYSYLLKDINKMFSGKMLMINNAAIGTLAQKIIYNDMDVADKTALLEHIKAIQTVALDNGENTASVSVIILDNAKLTGRFIIAAEKIAIKKSSKVSAEAFISGDIAGRKIKMKNRKSLLYRMLYKTAVIEISSSDDIMNDNEIAKVMRQVIIRLKAK
jgi:hypothetical protein